MKVDMNLLKQLRDATLASFAECKKALVESQGDLAGAKELLKERWATKAANKAERETDEGALRARVKDGKVLAVTLLCETDFVAKNETFIWMLDPILDILAHASDCDSKENLEQDIKTKIDALIFDSVLKLGENIQLGDVLVKTANAYVYNHAGSKLSSIIYYDDASEDIIKEVALQVVAMDPQYVSIDDVPADQIEKLTNTVKKQLEKEWKPKQMRDQIAGGKVKKLLADTVLLEQWYIRDGSQKVKDIVGNATIHGFKRISVHS